MFTVGQKVAAAKDTPWTVENDQGKIIKFTIRKGRLGRVIAVDSCPEAGFPYTVKFIRCVYEFHLSDADLEPK